MKSLWTCWATIFKNASTIGTSFLGLSAQLLGLYPWPYLCQMPVAGTSSLEMPLARCNQLPAARSAMHLAAHLAQPQYQQFSFPLGNACHAICCSSSRNKITPNAKPQQSPLGILDVCKAVGTSLLLRCPGGNFRILSFLRQRKTKGFSSSLGFSIGLMSADDLTKAPFPVFPMNLIQMHVKRH
jgi:hypothetical protein